MSHIAAVWALLSDRERPFFYYVSETGSGSGSDSEQERPRSASNASGSGSGSERDQDDEDEEDDHEAGNASMNKVCVFCLPNEKNCSGVAVSKRQSAETHIQFLPIKYLL